MFPNPDGNIWVGWRSGHLGDVRVVIGDFSPFRGLLVLQGDESSLRDGFFPQKHQNHPKRRLLSIASSSYMTVLDLLLAGLEVDQKIGLLSP